MIGNRSRTGRRHLAKARTLKKITMSKKLTVAEIRQRIDDVEGCYWGGSKANELWWRVEGDVHPTDRRLWVRYTNLLNKRLKEKPSAII